MGTVDNGYYINSWDYQATVHADNEWVVTETLTVTYHEPRHGIYHYLTRSYSDKHAWQGEPSQTFDYRLEIEDVQVEGAPFELIDVDDAGQSLNIMIGDADRTLTGQHTYVISYKMLYRDDRCEDYDQLFHSVMAGNVTTGIGEFQFNLDFDKQLPLSLRQPGNLHLYSGEFGLNKNLLNVQCQVSDASISGRCSNIPAYQAITLYARLPEGFYEDPLAESPWAYYGCFGITLAMMLYLLYDLILKRHPRKAVPVVSFYPPQGMSSAEVGTVIDDSADTSDLLSLLPWLAEQGYIRITEIPDEKGRVGKHADVQLELLRELPDDSPKYLHTFMQALFGKKMDQKTVLASKLDKECGQRIGKAKQQLSSVFTGPRNLVDISGRVILILFAVLTCTAAILYSSTVESIGSDALLQAACYLVFSFIGWLIVLVDSYNRHLHGFLHRLIVWLIVIALFAAGAGLCYCAWSGPNSFLTPNAILTLFAVSLVMVLFSGRYVTDTPYRLETIGQLLGLREFIKVAELPKLKMLVDEDPAYFYKVLPYAMAFGLSDKWVKQFADIDVQQPDWYHAASPTALSSAMLTQSISHSFSSISSQIAAQSQADAQVSGSASSGGFSGGGGGGGGTGSW